MWAKVEERRCGWATQGEHPPLRQTRIWRPLWSFRSRHSIGAAQTCTCRSASSVRERIVTFCYIEQPYYGPSSVDCRFSFQFCSLMDGLSACLETMKHLGKSSEKIESTFNSPKPLRPPSATENWHHTSRATVRCGIGRMQ